ncbi:MAG: hypothetical protein JWM53_233, partial [bacterium]|nr:hypothetical protein [bacterium]
AQPPAPAPPPLPTPRASLRVPALVLLGVTVALAATATGVYLSEWSDYQSQRTACMAQCSPQALDGLRTRITTAQVAGGVLFGLAGTALVADVILWIADARRPRAERRLATAAAGALEVRF